MIFPHLECSQKLPVGRLALACGRTGVRWEGAAYGFIYTESLTGEVEHGGTGMDSVGFGSHKIEDMETP